MGSLSRSSKGPTFVWHKLTSSPRNLSLPMVYIQGQASDTSSRTKPHVTSRSPPMTAEAIISLIFGALMFFMALLALVQGRRRRRIRSDRDYTSCEAPIISSAVNVVLIEHRPAAWHSREAHRDYYMPGMRVAIVLSAGRIKLKTEKACSDCQSPSDDHSGRDVRARGPMPHQSSASEIIQHTRHT